MKGAVIVNWTKDRSITLSFIFIAVFALILLTADIFCHPITKWFIHLRGMRWQQGVGIMGTVYVCSIFAWIVLVGMYKLLKNLRRAEVFVEANVRIMRSVSWCCVGAAVTCLVSMIWYVPFVFVAIAAGFMALIVRIVKNVFQQAIVMKDELDLTI